MGTRSLQPPAEGCWSLKTRGWLRRPFFWRPRLVILCRTTRTRLWVTTTGMSNLLAAVGRAQLDVLEQRIGQRLAVCEFYRSHLGDLPGLDFMPETDYGQPTHWLTCIQIDPQLFGVDREAIRLALERRISSRSLYGCLCTCSAF